MLPKVDKKISIVVPVYNAATTLTRCLDSILAQDFQNFEVYLINDGSTDDSSSICDRYALKYENFFVCHGANKGVSEARNAGIRLTSGYYITFIDADDFINTDYLSQLSHPEADIVICGCNILQSNNPPKREYVKINETYPPSRSPKEVQDVILNHHLVRPVWGKLFKKKVIVDEQIYFDSSIRLGEDTLFVLNYIYASKSASIIESCSYNYIRDGFKVNKFRNTPIDIISVYRKLRSISEKLEEKGHLIDNLHLSNYLSLCNNFYSVLYLSGKYNQKNRREYSETFNSVNPTLVGINFGISNNILAYMYKILALSKKHALLDMFLKSYYFLLKLKTGKA